MYDNQLSAIMTKNVLTATLETPLGDVLSKMKKKKVSCVIIIKEQIPLGIITERDIVRLFANVCKESVWKKPVSLVMSSPPITISQTLTISSALSIARAQKIRHLIVVNEANELVGLVTQSDLSKEYLSALNAQWESLERSIQKRVSGLESAVKDLREMALEDGLLRIANHRAMKIDLEHTHAASIRYKRIYSIILLDIDYFKNYNDFYGHPAGDEALKTVTSMFKQSIRSADRLYRYGGEEFVIVLPETDLSGACTCAQRLCFNITEMKLPHEKSTFNYLTVSGGISESKNKSSWQEVIETADKALYFAKQKGRNHVAPENILK
jgi:diguanylate cyclase (GGDEF)-like protein